jgi:VWFA-related protein
MRMCGCKSSLGAKIPRLLSALIVTAVTSLLAQEPQTPPPDVSLHSTTRVILVDAIVTDAQSQPVSGLKTSDFQILEDGKPQNISFFSDESRPQQSTTSPPKLPPGVFTNRPEYRPAGGPLTVILMDGLNTPPQNQIYVREQILEYLKTLNLSGTGTAVLALSNDLTVLQDFTTNPQLLQTAVRAYRPQRTVADLQSPAVDIPVQTGADNIPGQASGNSAVRNGGIPNGTIDTAEAIFADVPGDNSSFDELYQLLFRLEKMISYDEQDVRIRRTLSALRAIGQSVDGYPGRKTLLWFSSGFPFKLALDDRLDLDLSKSYGTDIKHVSALLAQANVAVYPIDAGVLASGAAVADPSRDVKIAQTSQDAAPTTNLSKATWDKFNTQETGDSLANETGGLVFRNTNDLRGALQAALEDSQHYYRLAYYPSQKKWDGKFHTIKVVVSNKSLKVRARSGYYAVDPATWRKTAGEQQIVSGTAFHQLAATGVTFITHPVLPPSGKSGPVTIEILVDSSTISFTPGPQSTYHTDVEFGVGAFTPEGKLERMETQQAKGDLPPETYQQFMKTGIPVRIPVTLKPGRYLARVAVRDNLNGNLGTLDVPLNIQ